MAYRNSISLKDSRKLWAKAAGRCSYSECRLELSIGADGEVIGEMAHIVAHSPDGPRGDSSFPRDQIDSYSNLMLLCPTHHKRIDTLPQEYPVDILQDMKRNHEALIARLIEAGSIRPQDADSSQFRNERKKFWEEFAGSRTWIVFALTPLEIIDEALNPVTDACRDQLNSAKLPSGDYWVSDSSGVNFLKTKPSENGLINKDLDKLATQEMGHRVEVFRNGHCEFLISIEGSAKYLKSVDHKGDFKGCLKVIRYESLAECIRSEATTLKQVWETILPFRDMVLSAAILNAKGAGLFSYQGRWDTVWGGPAESQNLYYERVINAALPTEGILELVLSRFSESFGLFLPDVFTDQGEIVRPVPLSTVRIPS